jgi:DNA replication protein DnaC
MMLEATLAKLNQLKLHGLAEALIEQNQSSQYGDLSFEERLGMLIDREVTARDNRRLTNLLRGARLRYSHACPEEIDFRTPRGLAKEAILSLAQNNWIRGKQNVIITGPTGSGKTFLSCALANSACRSGQSTYYIRLPRLLQEMHIARGDGSYGKLLTRLAKYALLIIDDWGLAKLSDKERRDLLEVLEDRHGISSTIISSQIPLDKWHDTIGDPTIADAVLDRLVHNAHMITMSMKAESMRKLMSKST